MRTVPLPETATIAQIAERAQVESTDIIVELLSRNVLATINAAIDRDTARAVLAKLGVDVTDE
ncbi:MAG: translation initiation factor IF-2 N-terminal domain-containing protein, partial [Chloroflexi bacterium]|nr:translation initiation factor IF-2 N-terminal domain-containing protein [Chloroflexota bacterium]